MPDDQPDDLRIERVDPLELDLDTAEGIAGVAAASLAAGGLDLPAPSGPTILFQRQVQADMTPVSGMWLLRSPAGDVLGEVSADAPTTHNRDLVWVRGNVHPFARRQGWGRRLLAEVDAAFGRSRVQAVAWDGSDGPLALEAMGFAPGMANAVRRIDVHGTPASTWQRLYDEAAAVARDYALERVVGPTPADDLDAMARLAATINDAPADEGVEDEPFDAEGVRRFDEAMARRRQTMYRVVARHRPTGEPAGLSMLAVDEFAPEVAFQEDTSVVPAHRGHRLGLLMKADMMRWIREERPEVRATDTWNATSNHHMIAVNEALGARVVATNRNWSLTR